MVLPFDSILFHAVFPPPGKGETHVDSYATHATLMSLVLIDGGDRRTVVGDSRYEVARGDRFAFGFGYEYRATGVKYTDFIETKYETVDNDEPAPVAPTADSLA